MYVLALAIRVVLYHLACTCCHWFFLLYKRFTPTADCMPRRACRVHTKVSRLRMALTRGKGAPAAVACHCRDMSSGYRGSGGHFRSCLRTQSAAVSLSSRSPKLKTLVSRLASEYTCGSESSRQRANSARWTQRWHRITRRSA